MHGYHPRKIGLALALGLATAIQGHAQGFPFSQRGSVSQTVAFTEITITYGRPVARGRTLFGMLVPWDSIWHPGADSATRIQFSREVLLEGKRIGAGEYSLWLLPRQNKPWTMILSRKAYAFHTPYPGSGFDAIRVEIAPDSGMHMESLAMYFPIVLRDTALLRVHWGTAILPIRIQAPYRPPRAGRSTPEAPGSAGFDAEGDRASGRRRRPADSGSQRKISFSHRQISFDFTNARGLGPGIAFL